MTGTIVEEFARFATESREAVLPEPVVAESKRILLDSLGCAVASVGERGADIGVKYGVLLGGGGPGEATIIGTGLRSSQIGAAFANAELINALDQDAILPPGHVTPYVLPGALAAGELNGGSGRELIAAIAVAHEVSHRLGKAMDYLRDVKDGVVTPPKITGYSSTVFGATAAIGMMRGLTTEVIADALGIAGCASPVNAHRAWMMHAPATTIKYQLAGALPQTAMMAAGLAELGHRGDRRILDDREYGFPRFIGTARWEPAGLVADLGTKWNYLAEQAYKPYPHCRIMHGLLDALIDIVEENDIKPDEIDSIKAWGESFVLQPIWLNNVIEDVRDAQFSMAHGLAVAAHRVPVGKAWQDPELVFGDSVKDLMEKVTYEPHPGYDAALKEHPSARLSKVVVEARGMTYEGERMFQKGTPSSDPTSYMATDELVEKFLHNVEGVLSDADAAAVVDAVGDLENVSDIGQIMDRLTPEGRA